MRELTPKKLLVCAALLAAQTAAAAESDDTLFQISTIDALLAGVYQGVAPVADALGRGDFGLGTFEALDGELIVLDGTVYQAAADGTVREMPPETGTPFIAVTRFEPDVSLSLPEAQSYAAFKDWLEASLPSRNIFYAIRVAGHFAQVTYRSVPRQAEPYPPLQEAAKHQVVFERQELDGALVGFWCPAFAKGINVPGFHLHFLSDDRKHAGHVLDFALQSGTVMLDLTSDWDVSLPSSRAFLDSDLQQDRSAALHSVEQRHSGP